MPSPQHRVTSNRAPRHLVQTALAGERIASQSGQWGSVKHSDRDEWPECRCNTRRFVKLTRYMSVAPGEIVWHRVHGCAFDRLPGRRGVNDLTASGIDPHMFPAVVQDHVTRLEVVRETGAPPTAWS